MKDFKMLESAGKMSFYKYLEHFFPNHAHLVNLFQKTLP